MSREIRLILTQDELECLFNITNKVIAWEGPMAMQMISELCGSDAQKWDEVAQTSAEALEKRLGLWNAIEEKIIVQLELA